MEGRQSDRWALRRRRIQMAAFVRRARAGRGGHGRAQGRQRGPAIQDVPVPAPVPVPVPAQELVCFGLPQGLLPQAPGVLTMLRGLVDLYNWMMPIRRRYLYKHINGERSKEMSTMEKTLKKGAERADEKIKEIKDAGGYCPPRPKLFDAVPKRKV